MCKTSNSESIECEERPSASAKPNEGAVLLAPFVLDLSSIGLRFEGNGL